METKPYELQSPEQIAKDYGGNKQKIAEAMQMGIVDPTAGTIAGMFIDRMRAAAQAEQAPQQTVAEQVFAPPAPMGGIGMPAPPAPPMGGIGMPPAPDGASAGLGATPEAAQMQAAMPEMGAPDMAPPEMAMEEAPMGMAEGGIAALPIPDTMFDEPNNGSYADGGIVAFAAGGETDGQRFERIVSKYIPGTIVTSRQRSAADNARVGGVPNSFHKSDRARDFVPPKGMSLTEFGAIVKSIPELKGTDAVFNSKGHFDHLHLEPGGKRSAAPTPREVDTNTFAGRGMSLEDQITFANSMYAGLPREAMDRAKAVALEELDPENIAKEKRYTDSKAIIAAGLDLMGGGKDYKGENTLGSIARAAAVGLESYGEARTTQKAAKNAAVRELMALEDMDRKTAIAGVELGMEAYKVGLTAEQQQRALDFDKVKLLTSIQQAGYDRASAEKIAGMRTSSPTQFESMMNIVLNGTPDQKLALEKVIGLQKPQTGMVLPGMEGVAGGAGDVNSGMSIVGSRAV